jgi:hypothetical protein
MIRVILILHEKTPSIYDGVFCFCGWSYRVFSRDRDIGPAVREGYRGTLVPLTSALAFLRKLWKQHLIISAFTTKRGFK